MAKIAADQAEADAQGRLTDIEQRYRAAVAPFYDIVNMASFAVACGFRNEDWRVEVSLASVPTLIEKQKPFGDHMMLSQFDDADAALRIDKDKLLQVVNSAMCVGLFQSRWLSDLDRIRSLALKGGGSP
jgi:hypothetical protein